MTDFRRTAYTLVLSRYCHKVQPHGDCEGIKLKVSMYSYCKISGTKMLFYSYPYTMPILRKGFLAEKFQLYLINVKSDCLECYLEGFAYHTEVHNSACRADSATVKTDNRKIRSFLD